MRAKASSRLMLSAETKESLAMTKANSLLSLYGGNYLLINLINRPNFVFHFSTETALQFIWTCNPAIPGRSTSG